MARIKAVKVAPVMTREEFESVVDEVAKMDVRRQKLVAELKKRHQDIDEKYGTEIKLIDKEIAEQQQRAADHAGELCFDGRRSGATKLANFGVRLGNPTVTKAGKFKKVAWKALGLIFDGIEALRQFVRNQPEVNKDAILEHWNDLMAKVGG